jgi:hypothetical protein
LFSRARVCTIAKIVCPDQDFSSASTMETGMQGFTLRNLSRFCAVISSRWANTQAFLAELPFKISPTTAESMIVLPYPVGATPSVLPRAIKALVHLPTNSF